MAAFPDILSGFLSDLASEVGRRSCWEVIDSDATNDPDSAANTAVPAGFADASAAESFIGCLGRNSI
jgi:hypothetical protein